MASAAPPPASTFDALDMVLAGMRYLNAGDPAAMVTAEQARILKTLEQVRAMGTAAHAAALGAFTARKCYSEDGQYSPRSWMIHQADVTRAAAWAHTVWSHRAEAHPKIAGAMAMGILSESWAQALCDITGKPAPGCDGQTAPAVACDAILAPVVTGDIDPATLDHLVRLCVELHRLDHHDPAPARPSDDPGTAVGGHGPGSTHDPAGQAPVSGPDGSPAGSLLPGGPDRDALREAIRQAIIGKTINLLLHYGYRPDLRLHARTSSRLMSIALEGQAHAILPRTARRFGLGTDLG